MIREIPVRQIYSTVYDLIQRSAYHLPDDYQQALAAARQREASPVGQSIIMMLQENSAYAEAEQIPTCQDTGMAIISLEVGQDVHFVEGDLNETLDSAVRDAYQNLRKSVIDDPLLRQNTGDNTPPIVHYQLVPGDQVHLTVMMKGFGAELMSRLQMFPPAVGEAGIQDFVIETIEKAGPNACPPIIVGIGLGSSFEGVALLAKKALMRPIDSPNPKPHLAQFEQDLLTKINKLGIGPQGLGGTVTALAVHVESYPTHIAALPVAVNLNCSAPRRATVTL